MRRPYRAPVGPQGESVLVVGPLELRRHKGTLLDLLGPGWSLLGHALDRDPARAVAHVRAHLATTKPPSVRVLVNTLPLFLGVYNGGANLIEIGVRRRMWVVSLYRDDLRSAATKAA